MDTYNNEFYTPAQLADKLQLNILTIYSYIRTKQLPAVKFGRSYRVSKSDLEKFINLHKTIA